jgi:calcium binding protein 39
MPPSFLEKLLKDKPRTVPEVVAKAVAGFDALLAAKDDGARKKAMEAINKYLGYSKLLLFGDEKQDPEKENVIVLAEEAVRTKFLRHIVENLELLEFEPRKDAANVFGALVRIKDDQERCPGALFILNNSYLLEKLFQG